MCDFLRFSQKLSPMSSGATFCDAVVSTRFDGRATSSRVSLDWVINSGVPTRGSRISGRLALPCDTGGISILLSDVTVATSLPCDLVLGLDWVQLMRKSAQRVVVHLSSGPLDFRTPGSSIGVSPFNTCISNLLCIISLPTSCTTIPSEPSAFLGVISAGTHGWTWYISYARWNLRPECSNSTYTGQNS
jgi:hypothetical protein